MSTHGSLFSGIGGFDLAAQWVGWQNAFHCEINPFCARILKHYWPNATSYTDITETDFSFWNGRIDILTGGFPCQPYSVAGKRLGKEDERHLWPQMLRAIREISPRWIVGENVRGLLSWNGGLVFDEVQADLETAGYEVLPFLLPACAVDAPHRRDRIWFVAHAGFERQQKQGECTFGSTANEFKCGVLQRASPNTRSSRREECNTAAIAGNARYGSRRSIEDVADADRFGFSEWQSDRDAQKTRGSIPSGHLRENWEAFPAQSPLCIGDDGVSAGLDGIAFSKWRNESIKGAGNAIVPQVAFQIFKAISDYEQQASNT